MFNLIQIAQKEVDKCELFKNLLFFLLLKENINELFMSCLKIM